MWVNEPNIEKAHIPERGHAQRNSLNNLGEILVFSPISFFSSLSSQALSVFNILKTDLRLKFTPDKSLKQNRKQQGEKTILTKFGLDFFLNPTAQIFIDISPSYNIKISQTGRGWKDSSRTFRTYKEPTKTHLELEVLAV